MSSGHQHPFTCLCAICVPSAPATPSPIIHSAEPAGTDAELSQAMALFQQLDAYGKAMTFSLMSTAVRLQGNRG